MTRIISRLAAVAVILLTPALLWAQAATPPAVAVVPSKAPGGPKLDAQLKKLEVALRGQVTVVPFKGYRRAAKKAKVKPKDIASIEGAAAIGRELQLTHVLIVQGTSEKIGDGKKRKQVKSAKVMLIAVETGETIFTQTYAMKGKKIAPDVLSQMASDVTPHLIAAQAPVVPEPVAAEPVPEPPPTPEPAAPTPPPAEPAAVEPPPVVVATEEPPPPPPLVERSSRVGNRWRSGFTLRLGGAGFFRNAKVSDSSASDPLVYEPKDTGLKKVMPAGLAQIEFYPLALGGDGSWYEGIGLEGEGTFTQVSTVVENSSQTTKSTVYGGRGGLSLRFVLWNSKTAADIKVRGGYALFEFPLEEGGFPSIGMSGPYAGATFTWPVLGSVALVLSGSYSPLIKIQDDGKNLGASQKSAVGLLAEGGIRFMPSPLEIGLMARYEKYDAKFEGASTLGGTAPVYTDAAFSDIYQTVYLTLGLQL